MDQDLPVYFQIRSIVTQSNIEISTNVLNYDNVYINQQKTIPLTIKNTSILPQKISFIKIKKEINISPYEGFKLLLPNEEFTFYISFCPSSILVYNFDLILLTNNNDHINIKINGYGIETPILLNKSVINFQTTSPGEKIIENIFIKNISNFKNILFEIVLPDERLSWIKVFII
jgi:hypothetical protein